MFTTSFSQYDIDVLDDKTDTSDATVRLQRALDAADLRHAFDTSGVAYVGCPGCGHRQGLKLSLRTQHFHCSHCGREGRIEDYLAYRAQQRVETSLAPADTVYLLDDTTQNGEPKGNVAGSVYAVTPRHISPQQPTAMPTIQVDMPASRPSIDDQDDIGKARAWGETLIIATLSVLFFGAGLAAAGLSAFANFQAFSAMVSDPLQARIWGWSGVIASVCSFGGFTFFWWHMSARRIGEAIRTFVFALAGAATSLAGTALYMQQNHADQQVQIERSVETLALSRAELADAERQLAAIPADTRSVAGLEAYLRGVEQVGRTHHKAYRDAQNELGQAQRREVLEDRIQKLRQNLRDAVSAKSAQPAQSPILAWIFALLLEVFSSQGTSIACVSLMLLCMRPGTRPAAPPGRD